jgi:acetolactate synthase small subunit
MKKWILPILMAGFLLTGCSSPAATSSALPSSTEKITETQMTEVFQIAQAMRVDVVDIGIGSVMLECRRTEQKHDDLIAILKKKFKHISVVRGGSVAIESISTECR